MTGDLMDKMFGDIKSKKKEPETSALSKKELSNEAISDDALSLKGIDLNLLQDALEIATSKRKMIGVWDSEIATAMQYLKSTVPRYSISEAAAKWIKEGLERDHPELMKRINEEMESDKKA
jgi:hypothetical protein